MEGGGRTGLTLSDVDPLLGGVLGLISDGKQQVDADCRSWTLLQLQAQTSPYSVTAGIVCRCSK